MNWDAIKDIVLHISVIVLMATVGIVFLLVLLNLIFPL